MLLNSLHAAYLHIYIKHRTHQSEPRDQRDTHRPNIIPLISTHTDTKTLSTSVRSLVALKPTERQSALSWSPIQTFMTSLNFQLCHRGLKSARFSLGLYGNARSHAHRPLNPNSCLPGFLRRGRRIHQHLSAALAPLSDQLGIVWKWVTVFTNTTPLRANATWHPSQNPLARLLHDLDMARLGGTHKWKVVFRKRGLRGTKSAIRMMCERWWSVRNVCKSEMHD